MAKPIVANTAETKSTNGTTRREIPGNLPYLTSPGTLKKALDRLIAAQRPDKFNADFLENILKLRGGSAKAVIPILKRMGFITSDTVPTELYAKFRTDGGRALAALTGLKNAFPEIFKRSEYAHTVDDNKLKDIIVEITGLKANEAVAMAIKGTFNTIKNFVPANTEISSAEDNPEPETTPSFPAYGRETSEHGKNDVRLSYNINIVIPETSDLNVLNAIFRSVKENLMK